MERGQKGIALMARQRENTKIVFKEKVKCYLGRKGKKKKTTHRGGGTSHPKKDHTQYFVYRKY